MKRVLCSASTLGRVTLALALFFAISSLAQNVTGVVTNGTSGKTGAGVEVTLITLGQGMTESGSTKTDAQGKYSLALDSGGGPHLIRASYQGTNYFKMVPPGFTTGINRSRLSRRNSLKVVPTSVKVPCPKCFSSNSLPTKKFP